MGKRGCAGFALELPTKVIFSEKQKKKEGKRDKKGKKGGKAQRKKRKISLREAGSTGNGKFLWKVENSGWKTKGKGKKILQFPPKCHRRGENPGGKKTLEIFQPSFPKDILLK